MSAARQPAKGGGDGWMLVSAERRRWVRIDPARVAGGRFLTRGRSWLLPQVEAFIAERGPGRVIDPFAGEGDLLAALAERGLAREIEGLDLDPARGWPVRDSLVAIDPDPAALFVTNPPFLARHSARRKGVLGRVAEQFGERADLYQVALDRLLEAGERVIAIVPETFLGSDYPKERLVSASVLLKSPFEDTECPTLVACFDGRAKPADEVRLFVGERETLSLGALESLRPRPSGLLRVRFNDPEGPIALQAVDTQRNARRIAFLERSACAYPPERIRTSSRLVTYLSIDGLTRRALPGLVAEANRCLEELRRTTDDLVLSPFKGNTREGRRRRRLDYTTARALLELAWSRRRGSRCQAPTSSPSLG